MLVKYFRGVIAIVCVASVSYLAGIAVSVVDKLGRHLHLFIILNQVTPIPHG